MQQSGSIVYLDLNSLIPNTYQPRKTFNENTLNELAASIKKYGVLNPILVRKKGDKYEIIAGERRCRASKIAGFDKIPAIIKEIDDAKLAEIALIENLQRENISPIEEAESYKEILELTNLTEQQLSELIGKSQSSISNKMRLLNLSNEVKQALNNRKISERHARSLLAIKNQEKQIELLNKVINEKLTVKELDIKINNEKDNLKDNLSESINKKELEKESDNMNNGNFFPNYNNIDQNNNNVSLNTMNMQTMPNMDVNSVNQAPSPAPTPNVVEQPMLFNPAPQMNQNIQPLNENVLPTTNTQTNNETISPIPTFGVNDQNANQPIINQPTNESIIPEMAPQNTVENVTEPNNFNDIPLFTSQNTTPEMPVQMENATNNNLASETNTIDLTTPQPQIALPAEETPLFTNSPVEQPVGTTPQENVSSPSPTFEVPVETPIPVMPEDKYTQVKNLLDSNGISYKSYSGDTGNCIIIEL